MLINILTVLVIVIPVMNGQITYDCNTTAPCGCSSRPAVISRIFGGESAVNNTWNWAVSILFNQSYFCGGVLISPSWVLTSASCVWVTRASEIWVSAGTNILLGGKQARTASLVMKHPNFDEFWWTDDIALIKVSSPFNMSDPSIGIMCLPNATNDDWPPVNSSLVTIGWGPSSNNGASVSLLRQVTLQRIASNATICTSFANDSRTQLCAMGVSGAKGVCNGDTGGPLMMYTASKQWMLLGINSYYYDCSNTGWPSVHTRIIPYLNWIRSMNVTDAVTVGSNDVPVLTTTPRPTTTITTTTMISASTTLPNQNRNSTQTSTATRSFDLSPLLTLCIVTMFIYDFMHTNMFTFIYEY